ncbi:MAG TPA: hypothetical protein VI032_13180 [Burkholderiaceae bacterium]
MKIDVVHRRAAGGPEAGLWNCADADCDAGRGGAQLRGVKARCRAADVAGWSNAGAAGRLPRWRFQG